MVAEREQLIHIGMRLPLLSFDTLSSVPIVVTKQIISSLVTVINWALTVYFVRHILFKSTVWRKSTKTRSSDVVLFYNRLTIMCTFICVISHALWPTFLMLQSSGLLGSPQLCNSMARTEYFIISFARTSFYSILALRARASFLGTLHEFSAKNLIATCLGTFIFLKLQTIACLFVQQTAVLDVPELDINVCVITWDWLLMVVYVISDVGITFWLMYLFGRKLTASVKKNPGDGTQIIVLLKKWLFLGWLSILGTWFFQIFGLFFSLMEMSASFDSLLNILCVITVYRSADGLYKMCCCKNLENRFVRTCWCCFKLDSKLLARIDEDTIQEDELQEMTVEMDTEI